MSGVCSSRILPTICVHMWRVARVSCHFSRISSGQWLLVMDFSVSSVVIISCGRIYHRGHGEHGERTETVAFRLSMARDDKVASYLTNTDLRFEIGDCRHVVTTTSANHAASLSAFHRWSVR